MAAAPLHLKNVHDDFLELTSHFDTLLMATCNLSGLPEASYAPYVEEEGHYYVYLSELASHTANLQNNPQCSVLFIENEHEAGHLFARRRMTYTCASTEIERDSAYFNKIMDVFESKFGEFMKMMRRLEDFHLFKLKPRQGKYVAGFAQAYEISGEKLDEVKHRNEQGHRRPPKVTQVTSMGVDKKATSPISKPSTPNTAQEL